MEEINIIQEILNRPENPNDDEAIDFQRIQNIETNENRKDKILEPNEHNEPPHILILDSGKNRAFTPISTSRGIQIKLVFPFIGKKRLRKVFKARRKKRSLLKEKRKK